MSIEQAMKKVREGRGTDNDHFVSVFSTDLLLTQAIAYDAQGRTEYIGYAQPGTAQAAAGWCIKKLSYDVNGVTDIQFANGEAKFINIWDDRAGLSYS